jgi:hypothetical protein
MLAFGHVLALAQFASAALILLAAAATTLGWQWPAQKQVDETTP